MATLKAISDGTEKRSTPLALMIIGLIRLYRITLSPILSYFGNCRFHPTCSQFGLEAVIRYGAFKGGWMTIKRILRCNPFFPGGYDPVE